MEKTVEEQKENIRKREEREFIIRARFYIYTIVLIIAVLLNVFVKTWNIYHTLMVVFWMEFSDLKNSVQDIKEKIKK